MNMKPEVTTRAPIETSLTSAFTAEKSIYVAVVLVVFLCLTARAEVVYTSVNVGIPANGSYQIDLNGDGVPDFIVESSVGLVWCQYGDGGYWKLTIEPAQNYGATVATGQNASALPNGHQSIADKVLAEADC
jgi:hypothetical protein